jgi:hypothetical protein
MPYFVKSRGPAVLNRGPFETYREANATRDELQQEPLYAGQEIYVEYVPYAEPERSPAPCDPPRRKYRSRSRSGSRVGGRSASSGGSRTGAARRKKRRTRRVGRRR